MAATSQPSLGAVLDQALLLPAHEQRQLAEAMVALTGGALAHKGGPELADAAGLDVHAWLQSIRSSSPWAQLQDIDASLEDVLAPEDEDVLRAARAALLAEHPQIAARNIVTNLVVQQPLAFAAGGVGLVLAVIAVGRGLFRLVF
ncbi:hypothetical protein [Ramlibacter albus]|uniref:Uncharacterized protein n=1 Tax=Ramlibacter albus TaxID=2079448 RepID=A0A923S808_9BURK|nr:hypothetical protein [Ramlibacter albus]MBC5767632.1 hypothetical protein [Ramlibacter albus]